MIGRGNRILCPEDIVIAICHPRSNSQIATTIPLMIFCKNHKQISLLPRSSPIHPSCFSRSITNFSPNPILSPTAHLPFFSLCLFA